MEVKTYKQYFPKDISCKMISGLKNANMEILDSLFDYENKQKKQDFRPMHLSIIDFDETADLGDFVTTEFLEDDSLCSSVKEQQHYMRILLGKLPNWHLVEVCAYKTGLLLYFYAFKPDGSIDDNLHLNMEIPRRLKMRVTIEADDTCPEEEYIILMKVSPENIKQVHLQYSIGGSKQYDSIIMSDESGRGYELINEA